MTGTSVEQVLEYAVYARDSETCITEIVEWVRHGAEAGWLACLNPHSYAVAVERPPFAAALHDATWLIADGVGVVLASRLRGGRIRQRITGSDVFLGLNRRLNDMGGARVFFIGSTEQTLDRIRAKMATDYPRLAVVGTYSPPFKAEYTPEELKHMVAAINAASPDVLWVGMTAPKQEMWIHQVRGQLNIKFAAAIGAVFDFYTGRIQRSHPMFQRLGLEWLPRLVQEPRRLWRRMLVSAPIFMWHVVTRKRLSSVNETARLTDSTRIPVCASGAVQQSDVTPRGSGPLDWEPNP